MKKYSKRTKKRALNLFGGACLGCGTTELAILTFDHRNDDGAEQRRNGCPIGDKLHLAILKDKINKSQFQILCHSCQWRKRLYGPNISAWPQKRIDYEESAREPEASPSSAE